MSNEFMREERYIVFKISDIKEALSASEIDDLKYLHRVTNACRERLRKKPLECVVVEKDWPEYEPTWKAIEARVTGAQPAPSFADAYQGAMEEVAIWKKRALEAEDVNRKFIADINGHTHMGEPAQNAASVPNGWLRAIDEALVVAHIGVANPSDTYEQARAKLDSLIGFHADVATDPAVNGGWKLVPIEPTTNMLCEMERQWMLGSQIDMAKREWKAALAAAPEVTIHRAKGEEK